jgi:hypothetical protein
LVARGLLVLRFEALVLVLLAVVSPVLLVAFFLAGFLDAFAGLSAAVSAFSTAVLLLEAAFALASFTGLSGTGFLAAGLSATLSAALSVRWLSALGFSSFTV